MQNGVPIQWWPAGMAVKLLGLGGTVGTCGSVAGRTLHIHCGVSKCQPLILGGLLGIYI